MKKYLKKIVTSEDVKYSQSYGAAKNNEHFAGYIENNWLHIYSSDGQYLCKKNTTAKHFHSCNGKEVTERSFNMLIKKAQKERLLRIEQNKILAEKENEILQQKFAENKEIIKNALTVERLEIWQKNEGNSHTRRTRWANRCERIGIERGYAGLLKDTFFEMLDKPSGFFVNGVKNPFY